jgi:hypothetical protein
LTYKREELAYGKRIRVGNISLDCDDVSPKERLQAFSGIGISDKSNDEVLGVAAKLLHHSS